MSLRRHMTVAGLVVVVLLSTFAITAQEAKVPVQEVFLDNGMKILMVERHESPTVSAGWVTHVGSVNEEVGATGIAHLFEHMMFKGSPTIGTSDYEQEAAIMAQLDELRLEMEAEYEVMREMKRGGELEGSIYLPENQTEKLAELREKMQAFQTQQKEFIVKDEFDQIYTEAGASGMNAGTSNDFTIYFITVPANKLELWFWMESERLLNAVFREFYTERDVVREERRMRTESNPTAKFEEQFDMMFWGSVPYHHPVVGWPSDVESITRGSGRGVLRHLLCTQQHHHRTGRRLRSRSGSGAGQEVSGPHPARRSPATARGHRGDRAARRTADEGRGRHQPGGPTALAHRSLREQRLLRA